MGREQQGGGCVGGRGGHAVENGITGPTVPHHCSHSPWRSTWLLRVQGLWSGGEEWL